MKLNEIKWKKFYSAKLDEKKKEKQNKLNKSRKKIKQAKNT